MSEPTTTPTGGQSTSPALVWAGVVVVGMVLATVAVLVILGKDPSTVIATVSLAALPLLGVIVTRLSEVKSLSNGNIQNMQKALVDQNKTLTAFLAQLPPVPATPAAAVEETTSS